MFVPIRRIGLCIALAALACCTESPRPAEKVCSTPGGSISIGAQVELEAICGCTRVDGDVSIDANAVRDLACLDSLKEITGSLKLEANAPDQPSLDSLDGLSALQSVRALALAGLEIRTLRPLSQLRTADSVILTRLPLLEALAGLEGDFDRLQITQCDRLTDLRGLRADLRDFWLEKSAELRTLEGFVGLPKEAGVIRLESLPELENVDALFRSNGPRIARLQLMALPKLERVDVRSARELGALVVRSCTRLEEIRGVETVETIGQLHLTGNPQLPQLPEFSSLRSIVDLELIELPRVTDLAPLSNVESLGRLAFTMMDGLVSLHGLEHVTRSGRVLLEDLLALESLDGLRGLQQVETLWIAGDDKLESLRGLGLVQAHELAIRYNEALTTLDGLETLRDVGTLDVSENPELTSVRGLNGLEQAGKVFAHSNSRLPGCELEWLATQLPSDTTRDFGNNGPTESCP